MESDIALARHVTFVHQFKKNPELDFEPFDPKFIKLYISQVGSLVCVVQDSRLERAFQQAARLCCVECDLGLRGATLRELFFDIGCVDFQGARGLELPAGPSFSLLPTRGVQPAFITFGGLRFEYVACAEQFSQLRGHPQPVVPLPLNGRRLPRCYASKIEWHIAAAVAWYDSWTDSSRTGATTVHCRDGK